MYLKDLNNPFENTLNEDLSGALLIAGAALAYWGATGAKVPDIALIKKPKMWAKKYWMNFKKEGIINSVIDSPEEFEMFLKDVKASKNSSGELQDLIVTLERAYSKNNTSEVISTLEKIIEIA